jgi:hypothetical protein
LEEGSVEVGSPEVVAGHGVSLNRGGSQGEHVVVRLHVRVVDAEQEKGGVGGWLAGGRLEKCE